MIKSVPPDYARRLDEQAIQVLREVVAKFSMFKSAAKVKSDAADKRIPAPDLITTILSKAVDRPQAESVALMHEPPQRADAFAAHIVWLSDAPLLPGRNYVLKAGVQTIGAMVTELKYRIDHDELRHLAAKELHRNEIAFVNIATVEPITFDPYEQNRLTGG